MSVESSGINSSTTAISGVCAQLRYKNKISLKMLRMLSWNTIKSSIKRYMSMPQNDLQQEAELIKLSFQHMYLQKGRDQEPHRELHAANLLESDKEWCTRRYVLMNLYPGEVQKPELKSWDWKREAIFEDGWVRHKKLQALFKRYGNVVLSESGELELDLTHYLPDENL